MVVPSISTSGPTPDGSYVCPLCKQRGCRPQQHNAQMHLVIRHGEWVLETLQEFSARQKQPDGHSDNALRDHGSGTPMSEPTSKVAPKNETKPVSEAQQDKASANNKVASGESYPGASLQGTSSQRLALERAPASTSTFEGGHDKETLITLRPPPRGVMPLGKEDQLMATGGLGLSRGARVLIRPSYGFSALHEQPVDPSFNALGDHGPRTPMSEPSSKLAPKNEIEPLSEAQQERGSANNKVTSGKSYQRSPLQMRDTGPQNQGGRAMCAVPWTATMRLDAEPSPPQSRYPAIK